jgi:hypothetical protein
MRLIDADALRKRLLDLDGPARSPVLLLDAAPTVSCAECEYGPPPADAVGARTACLHCYCGDNWERRQP